MIGKDNFISVGTEKVSPLCCTIIFVISGIKCNTSIVQRLQILGMLLLAAIRIQCTIVIIIIQVFILLKLFKNI